MKFDLLCSLEGDDNTILSFEERSKLLVMADYRLGQIKNGYHNDVDFFEFKNK